jgi:hypothetical protein
VLCEQLNYNNFERWSEMKKYLYGVTLVLLSVIQSAHSDDGANTSTGKIILGSVLVAGGIGGMIYENGKDVKTGDSSQTQVLSALSIVGGIMLFRSASKKTTVNVTRLQGAPALSINHRL